MRWKMYDCCREDEEENEGEKRRAADTRDKMNEAEETAWSRQGGTLSLLRKVQKTVTNTELLCSALSLQK